jgi:hypothetical protein
VTLVYLYWEPLDAGLSPFFAQHRAEIAAFSGRVAGGHPTFETMSYAELWDEWATSGDERLTAHVAALRSRYEVPAWAWEGVTWINGRITNEGFLDDGDWQPRHQPARAVLKSLRPHRLPGMLLANLGNADHVGGHLAFRREPPPTIILSLTATSSSHSANVQARNTASLTLLAFLGTIGSTFQASATQFPAEAVRARFIPAACLDGRGR